MSQNNGTQTQTQTPKRRPFDRPVILRQSPVWSRAIVWAIVGVTAATATWACVAKIEEAIPAQGKLEPKGAVKKVQAPVGGVVEEVRVEEGERVKEGDVLLTFDQTAATADIASLTQIRAAIAQENKFYRAQMQGLTEVSVEGLKELPEFASLTENRATLVAENRYYRAALRGGGGGSLTATQRARFRASQAEFSSRVAAARLEVEQLTQQLAQVRVQLANARDILATNQKILNDIKPLAGEGGIPRIQLLNQEQEVGTRQAEVLRLTQEERRLQLAISQAQKQQQNTVALTQNDLFARISENEKRIAEIDSQLTKAIVENQKQIVDIDGQLKQLKLTLRYQELKAPVGGTVFDLQAGDPGFVANTSEPVLKIVPDNSLVAKVFITNKDIGFVEEGMTVDVRIDSFPYSEFGDVEGKLVQIGSDVLPPDEVYPFYRFPAEIKLDRQYISIEEREVALQSGMSVSANIKVRKRTVISIFTDLFVKKVDSLKSSR